MSLVGAALLDVFCDKRNILSNFCASELKKRICICNWLTKVIHLKSKSKNIFIYQRDREAPCIWKFKNFQSNFIGSPVLFRKKLIYSILLSMAYRGDQFIHSCSHLQIKEIYPLNESVIYQMPNMVKK